VSAFHASLLVWGSLAVLVLGAELVALSDRVVWNSLSWTLWQLMARSFVVLPLLLSLLLVFALHIGRRHPKRDDPEGRN
jgi:hypothetical protein